MVITKIKDTIFNQMEDINASYNLKMKSISKFVKEIIDNDFSLIDTKKVEIVEVFVNKIEAYEIVFEIMLNEITILKVIYLRFMDED